MSIGITKREKRQTEALHSKIVEFIRIFSHMLPRYNFWFNELVADPRDSARIKYPQNVLFNEDLMRNITGVVTMRAMNHAFNTKQVIDNLKELSKVYDLQEIPDWQTINNDYERVNPADLEKVLWKIGDHLIKTRQFEKYKVAGCYRLILDGTGYAYFKQRHCEHDLVTTIKDKDGNETTCYYHKVVIAKLILAPKVILTFGVEFIENEDENVKKQDCENRAAKRLLGRIKKAFPRLPLLILGDALYGVEPMIKICSQNHWHYLFNLKEGTQPALCSDFQLCVDDGKEVTSVDKLLKREKEYGTATFRNGVEKITGKDFTANVLRYEYYDKNEKKTKRFQWITDLEITKENAEELVRAGRSRWKIENEGFNTQKRGPFKIEHHCSLNTNAMEVHFMVSQIADIVMQLYLAYSFTAALTKKALKAEAMKLFRSFTMEEATLEKDYIHKKTALHMQKVDFVLRR